MSEITQRQKDLMAKGLPKRKRIQNVKNVVLIASGKGGVGKSTAAVNIAISMARNKGLRVGLLDADVYGPSIPLMMNLANEEPPLLDKEYPDLMLPLYNHGVHCMSMGFLIKDPDKALVWRGPMVMSAVQKLAFGTRWPSDLDVLIVDTPPGTGDIHLSLAQTVEVRAAVVVSTPQSVALADATKAVSLFHNVKIPVAGFIENMGTFVCRKCGEQSQIFGSDGVKNLAEKSELRFLGSIPLDPEIMSSCDVGSPVSISQPDSPTSKIYSQISSGILKEIEIH